MIRQQFIDAYQYGHGFSRLVLFLREQGEKRFLEAFDLQEDLGLESPAPYQSELLGLSLKVFEPNALDGQGRSGFRGQAELGSKDKGRFSLY